MSDIDLESKFPDMRPLKSPPALGAVLGCGVSFYGRRDHDDETDTYVTTHCLSLLYLPVLALAAYRVADGHPGYYFLGRVPLSMGARLWNWLFLGVLLGLVGVRLWDKYTHSPGYLARQQMEEADRLADAGQVAPAARLYRDVALGGTEHAVAASAKVGGLVDRVAEQASSEEAVAVYRCAVEVQQRREAFPNLFGRGLDWVKKHGASDPRGALALLDVIAPLAPDETALNAARRPLLERVVARDPADPEPASQLAVIYEAEHHLVRCEALLRPHRRRLGTREGARILGQILARQGKIEQAHALLLPYAEEHLKQLHKAEEALVAAMRAVRERINKEAQVGAPPGFPLERYRRAGKEEQQKIEQEYILSRMKAAPAVKAAEAAVVRE
ncbi:MAG TPA: hypothetical protein VG013_00435, partial [Gemmataceae bacterium]|nr:hypothetical protein [Gemmataceae bacterium]